MAIHVHVQLIDHIWWRYINFRNTLFGSGSIKGFVAIDWLLPYHIPILQAFWHDARGPIGQWMHKHITCWAHSWNNKFPAFDFSDCRASRSMGYRLHYSLNYFGPMNVHTVHTVHTPARAHPNGRWGDNKWPDDGRRGERCLGKNKRIILLFRWILWLVCDWAGTMRCGCGVLYILADEHANIHLNHCSFSSFWYSTGVSGTIILL